MLSLVKSLIFVTVLLLSINSSLAGTQIVMRTISPPETQSGTTTLSIQDKKISIDHAGVAPDQDSVMIFDETKQQMLMVDKVERSYRVMDKKAIAMVSDKMAEVRKQMEEQMKSMPPEQAAMVKEMMANQMPGNDAQPKLKKEYKKSSRMDKAAGYDCQIYDVYRAGAKTSELCITPWEKLSNAAEIKASLTGFNAFYNNMMESAGGFSDDESPFDDIQALNGFPIIVKQYEYGQLVESAKLESIKERAISSETFNAPKGYRQLKMMSDSW